MKLFKRCPMCDSPFVCWNWFGNDSDGYSHECWSCDSLSETTSLVTDGMPIDLVKALIANPNIDNKFNRNILIKGLSEKSFKYEKDPVFKLASGKMSNYYINCKKVTLDVQYFKNIGMMFYNMIGDIAAECVGGLQFGADPIAMATAVYSCNYDFENRLEYVSIRKEKKSHGTMQWIEGNCNPGDRIVIVEDVITTGGSTIKAIERVRLCGLEVVKVITLVDRQEGGIENIQKIVDCPVVSIVTKDELMGKL